MTHFERRAVLCVCLACLSVVGSARAQDTPPPTRAFPPAVEPATAPSAPAPATVPGQSPNAPGVPSTPASGYPYAPTSGYPPAPTPYRPWTPPGYPPSDRVASVPAQDDAADRWDRNNLLEAHLGIGTPYGYAGVAYERVLVRYFGLVFGGGMGSAGPQAVAGIRARIPFGSVALGAELSWSGGPYDWSRCRAFCLDDYDTKHWDFAHWVNVSPAVELRSAAGFNARLYMGLGELLNDPDVCYDAHSDDQECGGSGPTLFFLGFSLGATL